ncbi:hypothetical protein J7I93_04445 [Bacillus sp. ISL-47]|uniref:hypothetical protein n=1 Tax=Bacillus sp. ISL-47 TaxID=2819130 RepID=UPI001BE6C2F9|nr:hypothetical protein [Bacillus sp. ISL-47]MBT2687428.1 hypothetical protein [Bacillus sp. ISL-47]MBT2707110.1 hypothetical protein [Pseudomonas sp. ISL-84]
MTQAIINVPSIAIQAAKSGLTLDEIITKPRKRSLFGSSASQRADPVFTFYYPYMFYEWKVTVPRFVFRDGKALIRIGVNGLTNVAAQTDIWPDCETVQAEPQNCLTFRVTDESADDECRLALENYVLKFMRPLKPPIYQLSRKERIYLPYHVFKEESSGKKTLMVTEALTGVTAEARKMKELNSWLESMAGRYS